MKDIYLDSIWDILSKEHRKNNIEQYIKERLKVYFSLPIELHRLSASLKYSLSLDDRIINLPG